MSKFFEVIENDGLVYEKEYNIEESIHQYHVSFDHSIILNE